MKAPEPITVSSLLRTRLANNLQQLLRAKVGGYLILKWRHDVDEWLE